MVFRLNAVLLVQSLPDQTDYPFVLGNRQVPLLNEEESELPAVERVANVIKELIKEHLLSHIPSLRVVVNISLVGVLHLLVDSSEQLESRL